MFHTKPHKYKYKYKHKHKSKYKNMCLTKPHIRSKGQRIHTFENFTLIWEQTIQIQTQIKHKYKSKCIQRKNITIRSQAIHTSQNATLISYFGKFWFYCFDEIGDDDGGDSDDDEICRNWHCHAIP